MVPNKNKAEEGITNLGMVPDNLSYFEAIKAIKHKRKYIINAYEGGHRLTICDTLRMTLREAYKLEDSQEKQQIIEYIYQAYDFGKRMDARMKYLKSILDENGIDYLKGG
jgi:NAD(P)H-nitrite reductase large subunit